MLLALVERREQGSSLLTGIDDETVEIVSAALTVIAKGRLGELIQLEMPYRLLEAIIKRSSEKELATLSDDELMPLFTSNLDVIRKAAALKAIRSFPKRRLKALLDRYEHEDGSRYYNVIYWLDFGITMPKRRVMRAAEGALNKR